MEGVTVGRIVHYVLPEGERNAGKVRPAIIVELINDAGMVNIGLAIGALAAGLTALVGSLTVDVLGYLKDRLNNPP